MRFNDDNESPGNDSESEQGKESEENETPKLPNPQETQSDHAKILECEFCKKTFKLNGRLKIHLKSKKCQKQNQKSLKRNEPKIKDSVENAIDRSKDEFVKPKPAKIARVEVEKQTKKFNFQCHKCPKTFEVKDEITDHVTFEHSKIICDICGKLFDQISALKKHFSNDHLNENVSCDKCDKIFLTKELLKEHQFMIHVDVKCAKCDQTFTNKELREHVEKGVSCQTCKIELCNDDLLADHLKLHKSSKCPSCDETFRSIVEVDRHVKSDHGKYACNICEESFVDYSQLLQHQVKTNHLLLTKYTCSFCGNQFKDTISLKKHCKFTCKVCKFIFCKRVSLIEHITITAHK